MDRSNWQDLVDQRRGVEYQFGVITPDSPTYRAEFDPGLTGAEVAAVESAFALRGFAW